MQKEIKQYSLWMVDLGNKECAEGHEQYGDRPFFVISSTEYNKKSKTPIGFFASTSEKKAQNKYSLNIDDKGSVNISQIRTLSQKRFKKCIDEIYSTNLEAKILSTFINQIILNGEFDDKDFIEIFNKKNNKKKISNLFKNNKSLTNQRS